MAQSKITKFFTFTPKKPKIKYYVYTDGACSKNGSKDAKAGIGIYFGEDDPRNVSRRVIGKQTNNTAELKAIIDTYPIIKADLDKGLRVCIVSDSQYSIGCATTYGQKNADIKWTKDIPNKELVREIFLTYKNKNIEFMHIKAHTGKTDIHSMGNDGADRMANIAIGVEQCPYNKIYLNVPFSEKEYCKSLGGKWDSKIKKWYIFSNNESATLLSAKYT